MRERLACPHAPGLVELYTCIISWYIICSSDDGGVDETTWQKYLKEKKQRRKEKKSKVKETESEEKEEDDSSMGFDDPFFQHDITTATAVSSGNSC